MPYVKFNDDDVQLTKVKCDYAPVEIQSIMSKYKDHDENDDDDPEVYCGLEICFTNPNTGSFCYPTLVASNGWWCWAQA